MINIFPPIALATLIWAGMVPAQASEPLSSQFSDNQSTCGPGELWLANDVNSEVADELEVIGNTRTGYTFDPANSVLTRSITR